MKIFVTKNNGTSGEISPRVQGRTDATQYKNAFDQMQNFLIKKTGGVYYRPGLGFIVEALDHSYQSRVEKFKVNTENTYVVEWGENIARPMKDGSVLYHPDVSISNATQANPCILTVASVSLFSVGDYLDVSAVTGMTELNGRTFKVASLGSNLIKISDVAGTLLDSSSYTAYSAGGVVNKHVTFATPYTAAEMENVHFAQAGDLLFSVHPDHAPRKFTRVSDTNWTVSLFKTLDGPYNKQNTSATTLTPSGTTGSITVTSSVSLFASTDVSRLISMTISNTRGWGTITAFSDSQNVTVSLSSALGGTTATTDWRLGAFGEGVGFPRAITFHEDRLVFGYTDTQQQSFWGSEIGKYDLFTPTETDLTVLDTNGYAFTLGTGEFDAITWLSSGQVLYIGTVGGVSTASGESSGITPSNIVLTKQNGIGANLLPPILINNSLIYISRTGREVREFIYSFNDQGFISNDLSVIAEHLFRTGNAITDVAYQLHPDGNIYYRLEDGSIVGMVFDREQNVVGFHRHVAGGSFETAQLTSGFTVVGKTYRIKNNIGGADFTTVGAPNNTIGTQFEATGISPTWGSGQLAELTDGIIESICSVPSSTLREDVLYCSVKRTIGGNTRRFIEYSDDEFNPSHTRDYDTMKYLDSSLEYSGSATSTIGNLWHLEGEDVRVLANYGEDSDFTVTNGSITISADATRVVAGLPYRGLIKLLPFEMTLSQFGDTTAMIRRAPRMYIKTDYSIGLKHGRSLSELKKLTFRKDTDFMGLPPELYSGVKDILTNQKSGRDVGYYIVQDQPYPLNILYFVAEMEVEH